MALRRVVDGGNGLEAWKEAANMLVRQSGTVDNRWYSSLGAARGVKISNFENSSLSRNVAQGFEIGWNL
jgi:hypothetical protein